jgi:1,4-alpha-glucan branching enzyme
MAAAIVIFFFFMSPEVSSSIPYRFVIYQPDVSQVEISGSFTEWRMLPMKSTGSSGYWELTVNLSKGEHRFTYVLDGSQRVADPTIMLREQDDFGGENSILSVDT